MSGRLRKSFKQRRLEGNPGRRPIPKEPDIPRWDGQASGLLPQHAKRFYDAFVPRLRDWLFASKLDEPMIILLSMTWGLAQQAAGKLRREGLTRDGHKNPAHQIFKDNAALFIQIAPKFGMTPADRARLFMNNKPKEDVPATSTLDGEWKVRPN